MRKIIIGISIIVLAIFGYFLIQGHENILSKVYPIKNNSQNNDTISCERFDERDCKLYPNDCLWRFVKFSCGPACDGGRESCVSIGGKITIW